MKRIVIVGGGTGGTLLANILDRREFDVTVVSASPEHLFQPALLYVAFGGASARAPVRDERSLLARHVRFVPDAVTRIDLGARVVTTARNGELHYDAVVVATGMRTNPSEIPGLAEVNAQVGDYHSDLAQAAKLRASLERFRGGTIALGQASPICKCPPSPLEGVLLADELLRRRDLRDASRLVLFTPYLRPYPAAPMSALVEPVLAERKIEVVTVFDVDRIDPARRTITAIEGDEIAYDLPIVIPPFVGADIAYDPPEVLDDSRFIRTDQTSLRVLGADAAFAIGDATNLPTSKAGVGAHLEAKVVARTLRGLPAAFDGRTNCPFDFGRGRGTFVVGSYAAPVVPIRPTRLRHLMKLAFARAYWLSLRGWLEPVLDAYFRLTRPKPARSERPESAGAGRR